MHDLKRLNDMLIKELEEFGKSGNLSKTSLDQIDKLAHASKNVAKVIECKEKEGGEYSNYGYSREGYSREGRSYADREPMSYGYSGSNDDLKGQLYKLMDMATDRRTREELRSFIDRM